MVFIFDNNLLNLFIHKQFGFHMYLFEQFRIVDPQEKEEIEISVRDSIDSNEG